MVETLHPDVFVEERNGEPVIAGASTSTAGFVGQALKGPVDKAGLVTSYPDFVRQYGEGAGGFLEDAVFGFFENGGKRAFIAGVKGAGYQKSAVTLYALGGEATPATITSGSAAPWDLEPGQTLVISVNGGGDQTFTFNATRAVRAGGAPTLPPGAASTLLVKFNGGATQTVIFAGTETTAALVAEAINEQVEGGRAVVNGANIDLQSDTRGTGSSVQITGGTALVAIGHTVGTTTGTGNVANIDAVTIAEALAVLATLTNASAVNDGSDRVKLATTLTGAARTVQVKNTSTATAFGFSNAVQNGSDAGAAAAFLTVTALDPGAQGDQLSATTQRWGALTTEQIGDGDTEVQLNDISKAQIGDIVTLDDGVDSVNVHVRSIDVANKRIQFQAISGLGVATIAIGATAKTSSSHRAKTALAAAALSADTKIKVTSAGQMHVGTLLTVDDGTNLLFRTVTKVNGQELTLNAALGVGLAQGTLVVTQSFDLTVKRLGVIQNRVFQYLSWEETDEQDYVEVRLNGKANESTEVTVTDLNPSILSTILERPAPVADVLLTGGDDGATPDDNDFLGSASFPRSGLHLFDDVKTVNVIAIPGVTTQAVQKGLADYATLRADVFSIGDGPLADEEPLEILDFRNNVLNVDSSYASLYYPWGIIRDRHGTGRNPRKEVPLSGHIAGLYAKNDNDENVSIAPANKPLLGVLGLTKMVSDGEHDLLNPAGINVVRAFPGEGIRVMGARTLTSVEDGRHYVNIRRLLLYVENALKSGLRFAIFRPNDPATYRKVEAAVGGFLRSLWNQSMLFPSNDVTKAFFVKCDEENNPQEERVQGKLNVEVGINPPYPAEFVVVRVGIFDGSSTVEELVGNR